MIPGNHFTRAEFACKCGCGYDTVDAELLEILSAIRRDFLSPVIVHSGCRCAQYNARVGGVIGSQHLFGRAADIVVQGIPLETVVGYLNNWFPDELGVGVYPNFIHIDTRSNGPARW